jgi:CubicO group peptidase (beta-lactamase class C family)
MTIKATIMNKTLSFCLLFILSVGGYAQTFPVDQWEINENPSEVGWDPVKMKSFNNFIIDGTKVTGLMIVHEGKVVYQYGDLKQLSRLASCRKSILTMLYGKYVENGTIDLNATLGDLKIDDIGGILPSEKKATVQDLLSARSAVFKPSGVRNLKRGSHEHGTYWLYNNWDFNTYGHIFELKTKNNIYDELESQLAIPLNFQDWDRSAQHKVPTPSSNFPLYQMWLSTRDFARIGYLMLNKGNWNGKQIVSEAWINELLKERTNYKEVNEHNDAFKKSKLDFGFGYSWWLVQNTDDFRFKDAYMASGARGNHIFIYPNINTVLAYVTSEIYERNNSMEVRHKINYDAAKIFDPNWKEKYITSESIRPIELSEDQIKLYIGKYQQGKRPPVTIKKISNGLAIAFPDGRIQELIPAGGDRFALKDRFITENIYRAVQFIRDKDGNLTGVEVNYGEFSLKRIR